MERLAFADAGGLVLAVFVRDMCSESFLFFRFLPHLMDVHVNTKPSCRALFTF